MFTRCFVRGKNEKYSRVEKHQEGRSGVGQHAVSDKVVGVLSEKLRLEKTLEGEEEAEALIFRERVP